MRAIGRVQVGAKSSESVSSKEERTNVKEKEEEKKKKKKKKKREKKKKIIELRRDIWISIYVTRMENKWGHTFQSETHRQIAPRGVGV